MIEPLNQFFEAGVLFSFIIDPFLPLCYAQYAIRSRKCCEYIAHNYSVVRKEAFLYL